MVLEQFKLHGKVAWVTGGTKGLGEMMAHTLAELGASVLVTSRSDEESRATAQQIGDRHGVRTLGLKADVTDPEAIAQALVRAGAELGNVDILVASAGVNVRKPTVEISHAEWQEVIDVNLTGPFVCAKAVIPGMIEKGWGRVVYMSSMLGQVGLAGRPSYTASKAGLIVLAKTQALELARTGVTVNAICPGPFATPMNKALLDDPRKYQEFVARIPMGRWGELHELSGAVAFFASNASSYVTGTTLTIDGGWTAQ